MKTKKIISTALLFLITTITTTGCIPKDQPVVTNKGKIELVYYKLFDDEDVFAPLIQQYQSKHPNVVIKYRKFTDPIEYQNLILNELAEGQGPDIFSMPNSWFMSNIKKIAPMPEQMLTPQQFDQTFVSVASKDLVMNDPADNKEKVFGIPLTVDTLALYFNKANYEDQIPSQGRPAKTWEGLKDDVYKLSKTDNSFERFALAGIAMGRSENILRAVDIMYMLMLQYKAKFYNDAYSQTAFAHQQVITSSGQFISPAYEAFNLYTSFAVPANKNYSWNEYLADSKSSIKEMETFARGKVAMIFGYSYLYEQLKSEIKDLQLKGVKAIDPNYIKISTVPQVEDPLQSSDKRSAFANYSAETVARTSKNPAAAWDFLNFISQKNNLEFYNNKTHRPTSRRDMIENQKKDPIYGVFAEQIGYADSLQIYDANVYSAALEKAIDTILANGTIDDAINTASQNIDNILPRQGFLPKAATVNNTNSKTASQQTKK